VVSIQIVRKSLEPWTNLIGTGDNLGKFALGLTLALDHGLDDAGMVGTQVDKAMGDAGLPDGLEKGKRRCIHLVLLGVGVDG
jgi:hypothetical protein